MFLRPTRASLQTGSLAVQGPDLQKYLTPILRQANIMIDLRRTSNLQNILRKVQGFLGYNYSLAKSSRDESSLDICSRRRTRCTVTTAPGDGTRHPQLQPALSSAGTDEWVWSWRLNEESDSSGDRRAVGGRFQVLGPYAAKLR